MTTPTPAAAPPRPGLLSRLALDRPELRAWAAYDWANSAMYVVIVTAIFPIFFSAVAGAELPKTEATRQFGIITTIGLAIIALLSPLLGAIADMAAAKKRLLGAFMGMGAVAVAMMFFIQRGDVQLASILFIVANIGVNGSFVFYDSLLPHVAKPDELDRVSTSAYAIGYLGGGLLLALCLAAIQQPGWFGLPAGEGLTSAQATLPTRLAFVATALWWVGFSIPLFRRVPEPPAAGGPATLREALGGSVRQLTRVFRELRALRQAFLLLVAFLIYNDGIGTIIRMAAIYGEEIGIERGTMILSILLVQFVGIPFAFLFGGLARRIGAKPSILLGLVAYCGVSVLGYFMQTATHFLMLAMLVGMVQGGTQALSRSLFASMIPRQKSGEFFGFFAVFEKFAGIFGPWLFAIAIGLSGSSRLAILSVAAFFLVGGLLLLLVNVDEGQRAARAAEAELASAPSHP